MQNNILSFMLFGVCAVFLSGCGSTNYYGDFFSSLDWRHDTDQGNTKQAQQTPEEENVKVVGETRVPLDIIDTNTRDISLLKATQYNFGSNITLYPLDEDISQRQARIEKPQRSTVYYSSPNPNVIIYPLDGYGQEPAPAPEGFQSPFEEGAPENLLPMPNRKPGEVSKAGPRVLTGY